MVRAKRCETNISEKAGSSCRSRLGRCITSTITGVEYDPGKPAVPAVPAVEANPGRPSSGHGDPGEPPTEAVSAKEATPGEPAVPPTCTISYGGGSAVVQMQASHLVDTLNS
jgi:hypothetical protein